MTNARSSSHGAVLVGVIVALLILTIFVPAMVYFVQNEAKHTMKQKRSTAAFYAAMSGVDRCIWKLKSSTNTFEEVLDGNAPSGYTSDVTYTDIPTGAYKVFMASTSTKKEIVVFAYGRDSSAKEFRLIEVHLKTDSVVAAIYAPSVTAFGSSKVFWGPLMANGNMVLQGSANELYPRKLARGAITASGGGYPTRDASSAAPNTDGIEWWSYNEPPGVPDPLPIDLDYYREAAKDETGCPAGGTPAGSCYYAASQNWASHKSTATKTYFFELGAKFSGSKHFRGYMFVMTDLDMSGSGQGVDGAIDYGHYIATVPATVYQEYQKNVPNSGDDCRVTGASNLAGGGDGLADDGNYNNGAVAERDDEDCHQYPGDWGYRSTETYKFGTGCVTHGNAGGAGTEPIHFKGLIYVKGDSKIVGNSAIHGAFISDSGSFSGGGSLTIFFDDSLELQLTNIVISQVSWKELPGQSF